MDEDLMRRIRALEKGARMSKILIAVLALVVAALGVGIRALMREDVQYRRVAMRELAVIDAEGRERLVGTVDAQGAMGLAWRSCPMPRVRCAHRWRLARMVPDR